MKNKKNREASCLCFRPPFLQKGWQSPTEMGQISIIMTPRLAKSLPLRKEHGPESHHMLH